MLLHQLFYKKQIASTVKKINSYVLIQQDEKRVSILFIIFIILTFYYFLILNCIFSIVRNISLYILDIAKCTLDIVKYLEVGISMGSISFRVIF